MKKILLFIFSLFLIVAIKSSFDFNKISESVIRLHVVANSNEPLDQNIKLKVRDYILSNYNLEHNSIYYADSYINDNLNNISSNVTKFLNDNGYNYSGKAEYGFFDFPTKSYKKYKFPKGKYKALKITLGSGTGENWWCVMYPPICVYNNCYKESNDENDILKKTLSSNQYQIVSSVNYEFKIIELINTIKEKI